MTLANSMTGSEAHWVAELAGCSSPLLSRVSRGVLGVGECDSRCGRTVVSLVNLAVRLCRVSLSVVLVLVRGCRSCVLLFPVVVYVFPCHGDLSD